MERDIYADSLLERCEFPAPQTAVCCAVSGGADSLALLILACRAGLAVTAIHVDHGLREGSADEADVVRDACELLGAEFRAERVTLQHGANLEARAREARRAAVGPDAMTGHTADDRVATMLMNLMRGSGPWGLAAMAPSPRRPILRLRRSETEKLVELWGLPAVVDESNKDTRFTRNRVRRELLPLMNDIARRDVVPVIARYGDHMCDVVAFVDGLSEAVTPSNVKEVLSAPPLVARAALRRWLRQGRDDQHPVDAATVDRVLDVASGRAGATQVGDGRKVRRSRGRLYLE